MKRVAALLPVLFSLTLIGAPAAYAQIDASYIQSYSGDIIGIINGLIVPVLLAVAFLFFMWGVVNYFIFGATSEEKQREGRQFILWSVVGFAVIFSVWGLVSVVGSTFNLTSGGTAPPYPTL